LPQLGWAQVPRVPLRATDGAPGDQFGSSVALDGNLAVIGTGYDDDTCPAGSCINSGSAYIFVRAGGSWAQQAKLTAEDAALGDFLGLSVAISGRTAVASSQSGEGAVYVFFRSIASGTWVRGQKLIPSLGGGGFVNSVSIDGNTIVAGTPATDDGGFSTGSAYVFVRESGLWEEQTRLTAGPGDVDAYDNFGESVSVSGDTLIIGVPGDDEACPGGLFPGNCGAAYIFRRTGTEWDDGIKITASDAERGDDFGLAVAINGDTAVVGARFAGPAGQAYVFVWDGTDWTEQQILTPSTDAPEFAQFGSSVEIKGDTILVGARLEETAYVFRRSGTAWVERHKLSLGPGRGNERFADPLGEAVAFSEDFALVGAPGGISGPEKGAAYAFDLRERGQPAVLFLHGIIASELYEGPEEEKVWVRLRTSVFDDISLTERGERATQVFPREQIVVTEDPRPGDVYKKWVGFLSQLRDNDVLSDFYTYAYDWRLPWTDVVENGTLYRAECFEFNSFLDQFVPKTCGECVAEVGLPEACVRLEEKIEELAKAPGNVNKEVWIVAHSMGGLITKRLLMAMPNVRDHLAGVILTASPQIGTPQAIAQLLHGEDNDILKYVGLGPELLPGGPPSLSEEVQINSRKATRTWPSAYALLPFMEYFDRVLDPVLVFKTKAFGITDPDLVAWNQRYGGAVDTWAEMEDFVLGRARVRPQEEDILTPDVIDEDLFESAVLTQQLVALFDPDGFATPLPVFQIVGWGQRTVRGIVYAPSPFGKLHSMLRTCDGDGTVVVPSAAALPGAATFYLNLRDLNQNGGSNFKHRNILEVVSVQQLIRGIVTGGITPTSTLPAFITTTKPSTGVCVGGFLRTRSPAEINAFQEGQHTGPKRAPPPDDEFFVIEDAIPNSDYELLGKGRVINLDGLGTYDILVEGTGIGTALLEVGRFVGDEEEQLLTIPDIPLRVGSRIEFEFDPTSTDLPEMTIDVDGDGTLDFVLPTDGTTPGPEVFLGVLRSAVKQLADDTGAADLKRSTKFVLQRIFLRSALRWLAKAESDLERKPRRALHRLKLVKAALSWYTRALEHTVRRGRTAEETADPLLADARAIISLLETLKGTIS